MLHSVSEFFGLDHNLSMLKVCLDYQSRDCKRLAWYGDKLVSMSVGNMLFLEHSSPLSIGELTKRNARYTGNASMKQFLIQYTDVVSRLFNGGSDLNEHTWGTVFEALVSGCRELNGLPAVEACLKKYFTWVDENLEFQEPIQSFQISFYEESLGFVRETLDMPRLSLHGGFAAQAFTDEISSTIGSCLSSLAPISGD